MPRRIRKLQQEIRILKGSHNPAAPIGRPPPGTLSNASSSLLGSPHRGVFHRGLSTDEDEARLCLIRMSNFGPLEERQVEGVGRIHDRFTS
jgi:hypothetical protein